MKAVVVPQPKATLVALGIKTILDMSSPPNGPMRPDGVRGLPGLAVERGARIAIVAGATEPSAVLDLGHEWGVTWSEDECGDLPVSWAITSRLGAHYPLPLGAVVCTVEVANAAEIATEDTGGDCWPTLEVSDSTLTYWRWGDGEHPDAHLDDQLPLGDFTPGRWGWMLSDPRPCDPVPCKGRQGVFELPVDLDERSAR